MEILFRAWDGKRYSIGNPEYFDDSVNFRFHHFDINCEKPILEQFTGLHDATKWGDLTDTERDEWIKSGHTKEDWKGRRIFEGDIFISDYFEDGTKFVVVFEHGAFCGKSEMTGIFPLGFKNDSHETGCEDDDFYYPDDYSIHIKVVGNIHDNPAKDEIQP